MTTPLDIITQALKDIGALGVGVVPLAEDVNDAFVKLNWMISQWQRKRWLIWHLKDLSCATNGNLTYTVGPGGNFNIALRPDKIYGSYLRYLGTTPVDFPLEMLTAREDYARIAIKSLASFPSLVWYDAAFPTGLLYPWPVPQQGLYELHILVSEILSNFASLTTVVNLPPEYFAAIHYNLAVRLAPGYGYTVDPVIVALAKDSLQVIRGSNSAIARLRMPDSLPKGNFTNSFLGGFGGGGVSPSPTPTPTPTPTPSPSPVPNYYDQVFSFGDFVTVLSAGTNVVSLRTVRTHTVVGVVGTVATASTSGAVKLDIKVNGVSILTVAKCTIDQGATTSVGSTVPTVLLANPTTITAGDLLTFDITQSGTGAIGAVMQTIGTAA